MTQFAIMNEDQERLNVSLRIVGNTEPTVFGEDRWRWIVEFIGNVVNDGESRVVRRYEIPFRV